MDRLTKSALALGTLLALATAAQAQAPLRKVTVNYGLPFFAPHTAPMFTVPKEAGFWKEEGLDVEIQTSANAGAALQQLSTKRAQLTMTATQGYFVVREAGAPLKTVASAYAFSPFYPAALADGPVKSIKDFKGKTIGTCGTGAACELTLEAMMKYEGMNFNTDIQKVGVGDGAPALNALLSGRIAAYSSFEGQYVLMELQGAKLRRFNDHPVIQSLNFVFGAIAHEDTMRDDPKLIESILRGVVKGMVFSFENPEKAIKMHWAALPTTKPNVPDEAKALADAVYVLKSQLPLYKKALDATWGELTAQDIVATRDFLAASGAVKTPMPPEQYFDGRFLAEANKFDREAVKALARK